MGSSPLSTRKAWNLQTLPNAHTFDTLSACRNRPPTLPRFTYVQSDKLSKKAPAKREREPGSTTKFPRIPLPSIPSPSTPAPHNPSIHPSIHPTPGCTTRASPNGSTFETAVAQPTPAPPRPRPVFLPPFSPRHDLCDAVAVTIASENHTTPGHTASTHDDNVTRVPPPPCWGRGAT
jgi:hypothetical protein